jgi:hypothetical protein
MSRLLTASPSKSIIWWFVISGELKSPPAIIIFASLLEMRFFGLDFFEFGISLNFWTKGYLYLILLDCYQSFKI